MGTGFSIIITGFYMILSFKDKRLYAIKEKIETNTRLDHNDGLTLFDTNDLIGVGALADYVRRKRHGNKTYYVYNQHINYTNICKNRCLFCAFARDRHEKGAYMYSVQQVRDILMQNKNDRLKEIHMVGGIHPNAPFEYYLDLLHTIREVRPNIHIKAFTAVEIDHFSSISELSLTETIKALKKAGLNMVPGGGSEVMSDRIHKELFPKKIHCSRWTEVMKAVHAQGITSNATMLYGHIETSSERVAHLIQLRKIQDETNGFTAFIPLAFHSENTKLSHIPPTSAYLDLKMTAIARLILDNFDHIKAYWVMLGEKLAQIAQTFGADDLDGTIIDEKITHSAGARSSKGLTRDQLINMIRSAGFEPVERDALYQPVRSIL
ncbi:MAG: radical SAM domain-containing protein [Candidatus Magnetoglobus multicellularis str. Araruama]|uniref:Aminodeoxyfutalosine synthase n=1 Tax=Candidatus Magnetoglobus multicellularis str. Araruama TaxID=890399 RepID=A0A1V1PAU2_9BACT|nr:MAG: radical SAM domain-containing protein [Candidatus Magnetoglobus multicellularis str. Araruama]